MEAIKTADGHEVEKGHFYYNSHGEQIQLDEIMSNQDGKVLFLVTPLYEGEAIDVKCYGGPTIETGVPYEHDGAQRVEPAIYKNEPVAKIGEETAKAKEELVNIGLTYGKLEKEITLAKINYSKAKGDLDKLSQEIAKAKAQKAELDNDISDLVKRLQYKATKLQEINDLIKEKAPGPLMPGCRTITDKRLLELIKAEHMLACLDSKGVDNWICHDDAINLFREKYPEED